MQSFFSSPTSYEAVLSRALMCDDELDRHIEIKQYYAGSLSPCFVKFDAEGLGVASSVRLVGPIIEAFVRPRAILDSDDGLCFYFSIDESRADRVKLEDCAKRFSRHRKWSALLIETAGRFADRALSLVLVFDQASRQTAQKWADANFNVHLLGLDSSGAEVRGPGVQDEAAA